MENWHLPAWDEYPESVDSLSKIDDSIDCKRDMNTIMSSTCTELRKIHERFESLRLQLDTNQIPTTKHEILDETTKLAQKLPQKHEDLPHASSLHLNESTKVADWQLNIQNELQQDLVQFQSMWKARIRSLDKTIEMLRDHTQKHTEISTVSIFIRWLSERLDNFLTALNVRKTVTTFDAITNLAIERPSCEMNDETKVLESQVATLIATLLDQHPTHRSHAIQAKWSKKYRKLLQEASSHKVKAEDYFTTIQTLQNERNSLHGELRLEMQKSTELSSKLHAALGEIKTLKMQIDRLEEQSKDQADRMRLQTEAWEEEIKGNNTRVSAIENAPSDIWINKIHDGNKTRNWWEEEIPDSEDEQPTRKTHQQSGALSSRTMDVALSPQNGLSNRQLLLLYLQEQLLSSQQQRRRDQVSKRRFTLTKHIPN